MNFDNTRAGIDEALSEYLKLRHLSDDEILELDYSEFYQSIERLATNKNRKGVMWN